MRVASATGIPAGTLPDSSLHPFIAERLRGVVREFEAELSSPHAPVSRLCRHVERYRGKMLRPTIAIVSGVAAGGSHAVGARHERLGAVLELIHMATLVHDDILDDADVRRGGATVNAEHGVEAAVLLGDYLISSAFHLCSRIGTPSLNEELGRVTSDLCAGELLQQAARDRLDLSEPELEQILRLKTGVLIGAAARTGAREAGASDGVVEAMDRFGTGVGIAFQMQDDVLDLVGSEEAVGKSVGRDLAKGKLTMPVVFARARASNADRASLDRAIQSHDGGATLELVKRSGGLEAARQLATDHVERARAELGRLPASEARDLLDAMALEAIQRTR
ncbi:MAG: polyprenyl synthetase family protein [Planctomycetota bacterium]|nr:polyprenyl synthetase family protein [Planctomycetota bacterium]MDA1105219.1 polyprenyl synthetase family protein [Planctomycetota bacterium]